MTNTTHKSMPSSGREGQEILTQLDAFKAEDPEYKNGKVWSLVYYIDCLLYTSPSPRDQRGSRMPSSA